MRADDSERPGAAETANDIETAGDTETRGDIETGAAASHEAATHDAAAHDASADGAATHGAAIGDEDRLAVASDDRRNEAAGAEGAAPHVDATRSATPRPSRRRRLARTIAAAVALVVVLLAALAYGPVLARNASTTTVEADTPVSLADGSTTVHLVAPAGWHVIRPLGGGDRLALETPDGLVELTFSLGTRPDATVPPAEVPGLDATEAASLAWSTEQPYPGLRVAYARLDTSGVTPTSMRGLRPFDDGSPAHPGLVAFVQPATGTPAADRGAVVDVLVTVEAPLDPYLTEFARVVGGMAFE